MSVFEKRILRTIFGAKKNDGVRRYKIRTNEELKNVNEEAVRIGVMN